MQCGIELIICWPIEIKQIFQSFQLFLLIRLAARLKRSTFSFLDIGHFMYLVMQLEQLLSEKVFLLKALFLLIKLILVSFIYIPYMVYI